MEEWIRATGEIATVVASVVATPAALVAAGQIMGTLADISAIIIGDDPDDYIGSFEVYIANRDGNIVVNDEDWHPIGGVADNVPPARIAEAPCTNNPTCHGFRMQGEGGPENYYSWYKLDTY